MATKQEMLIEANNRGLLSGRQKELFDQAVSRGLISTQPQPQPQIQPPEFNPAEGIGAGEAALIATGRGFTNIGRGAQRLLASLTGDEEEEARLQRLGVEESEIFRPLQEAHPVSTFVGEVVGESAALPIGGIGKSLIGRGITAATAGATAAGLSESGRGGTAADITEAGIIGGVLGPVGEAAGLIVSRAGAKAAPAVKKLISRATGKAAPAEFFDSAGAPTKDALAAIDQMGITPEEFKSAFGPVADQLGLDPAPAFRQARAGQEGVRLSAGQSSREFAQSEAEQTLKSLATEEGSKARAFFDAQQIDLLNAKNRFIEKLGGTIDATREARGEAVQTALQDLNAAEKQAVSDLYGAMREIPGGEELLPADGLIRFKDQQIGEYAPTERIQKGVDRVFNDFELVDSPKDTPTSKGPLSFANAETFRQRLGKLKPTEPSDVAVIASLKDSVDSLLLSSVEQLPENTPISDAARLARSAASARFDRFEAKDIVQDLTSFKKGTRADKVHPAQVIDKIFAGGNKKIENIRAVKKVLLRNPTPETKQAWKELQAEGALQLFSKATTETPDGFVISGLKLNSAVRQFGDDGLKQLLSANQMKELKRLQSVIGDATIPVSGTTNPSGTAAKLVNIMNRLGVISSGGLADRAASLTGAAVGAVKESAKRQEILRGIQKGAKPQERVNSILRLSAHLGAHRSAVKALEDEE